MLSSTAASVWHTLCKDLMQLTVLQLAACTIHIISVQYHMSHQCYPGHADLCAIVQVTQSCPGHAV